MSVVAPDGPTTMRAVGRRSSGIAAPLAGGVVLALLWEAVVGFVLPQGFLLPAPSAIVRAFAQDRTAIWQAARTTGFVVLTGLAAGVVLGVVAALVTTRSRTAQETVTPLAAALNAMPIIALAPLFNAWFGSLSPRSNQAVVAVVTFFPVFINTARGLSRVDPQHLELMRSYAASEWAVLRRVRIPSALPLFFTSLRIVASLAVIAAIVDEYFGGPQRALGPVIVQRAGLSRYDDAWAAVLAGAAMGIALYLAAGLLERLALPRRAAALEDAP